MSTPVVQHDYSADVPPAEGGDLATLANLAEQQREAELYVEQMEERLKSAQMRLLDLSDRTIPELMKRLGIKEFKTQSGLFIKIKRQLRVSVPKHRVTEAVAWVENNGGADLVKRAFHIMFGRDEEAWASKFERDLKQRKKPLRVERTQKVEPSTLKAFLEGKLEAGIDVPLETFGGFIQEQAKIDLPT